MQKQVHGRVGGCCIREYQTITVDISPLFVTQLGQNAHTGSAAIDSITEQMFTCMYVLRMDN